MPKPGQTSTCDEETGAARSSLRPLQATIDTVVAIGDASRQAALIELSGTLRVTCADAASTN